MGENFDLVHKINLLYTNLEGKVEVGIPEVLQQDVLEILRLSGESFEYIRALGFS